MTRVGAVHAAGLDALGVDRSQRPVAPGVSAHRRFELVGDPPLIGHDGYTCEGAACAIESAAAGGVGELARATGDEEGTGERGDPLRVGQRTRPLVGPAEFVAVCRDHHHRAVPDHQASGGRNEVEGLGR